MQQQVQIKKPSLAEIQAKIKEREDKLADIPEILKSALKTTREVFPEIVKRSNGKLSESDLEKDLKQTRETFDKLIDVISAPQMRGEERAKDILKYSQENKLNPAEVVMNQISLETKRGEGKSLSKRLGIKKYVEQNAFIGFLKEQGVDLSATNSMGKGIAHQAALHGRDDILFALHNNSVSLSEKDNAGREPAHYAAAGKGQDVIPLMKEMGVSFEVRDKKMNTPLLTAITLGDEKHKNQSMAALLISGKNIANQVDENGNNAAHVAAQHLEKDGITILSEGGVDFAHKNKEGKNPAHIGVVRNQPSVMKALHESGSSLTEKDNFGKTPSDYASLEFAPVVDSMVQRAKREERRAFLVTRVAQDNIGKEGPGEMNEQGSTQEAKGSKVDILQKKYVKGEGITEFRPSGDILSDVDAIGAASAVPSHLDSSTSDKPAGHQWAVAMYKAAHFPERAREEGVASGAANLESVLVGLAQRGIDFRERDHDGLTARQSLKKIMEEDSKHRDQDPFGPTTKTPQGRPMCLLFKKMT